MTADHKSQSDKFKETARELGADEDEERWEERLKKIAKPRVRSLSEKRRTLPRC